MNPWWTHLSWAFSIFLCGFKVPFSAWKKWVKLIKKNNKLVCSNIFFGYRLLVVISHKWWVENISPSKKNNKKNSALSLIIFEMKNAIFKFNWKAFFFYLCWRLFFFPFSLCSTYSFHRMKRINFIESIQFNFRFVKHVRSFSFHRIHDVLIDVHQLNLYQSKFN